MPLWRQVTCLTLCTQEREEPSGAPRGAEERGGHCSSYSHIPALAGSLAAVVSAGMLTEMPSPGKRITDEICWHRLWSEDTAGIIPALEMALRSRFFWDRSRRFWEQSLIESCWPWQNDGFRPSDIPVPCILVLRILPSKALAY